MDWLSSIFDLPKKLRSTMHRFVQPLIAWSLRSSGIVIGREPTFYGRPLIQLNPSSTIIFGDRIVICSDSRYTALALNHPVKVSTVRAGARITIWNDVGLSGTCIVCAENIDIGSEVLLGANVLIVDTDFHPIAPEQRRFCDDEGRIRTSPVHIGCNVFVGTGVIILKGVSIGDDSVVAAGAVVTAGDYAAGAILAGNPARIIGSVYQS
jgi:acetyltransferase-like isoleucine patch superfamily enzyme